MATEVGVAVVVFVLEVRLVVLVEVKFVFVVVVLVVVFVGCGGESLFVVNCAVSEVRSDLLLTLGIGCGGWAIKEDVAVVVVCLVLAVVFVVVVLAGVCVE